MRFKLDENLSRSVAELFRSAGHDATTGREQGLQAAPDDRVFDVAAREGRTLVTPDRDLGQVLRFPPEASAGIIVIDAGPRASHRSLLDRARELLTIIKTRSPERALWVVEPGRVRVHLAKDDKQIRPDMDFRIADTFTASLARLNGAEQKAVKTTAFDLQLNLSGPGLQFHRLDRPRDPNFWSVRVSDDIRLIVHRTPTSLLLCYVGHHDQAYAWAERRRIERHPMTGAAQLVELPERVDPRVDPRIRSGDAGDQAAWRQPNAVAASPKLLLFAGITDDALLGYGVPTEWLRDVRHANEDSLFEIAERLPQEAAEALLELATGTTPVIPRRTPVEADPFAHPDAQRRFRELTSVEELERALHYPWDKWAVFLHPAQRRLVERDHNGPARISGSAGTGKTIVALHRAVALARRHPEARVLLTTFSKALANALRLRLRTLTGNEPDLADRIAVHPVTAVGYELYTLAFGQPNIAPPALIEALVREAATEVEGHRFSPRFLVGEWREVVDAWQLES